MGGGRIHQFQIDYPFEKRLEVAQKMREKYPNRIPVLVENAPNSNLPQVEKRKYLVPLDITMGRFLCEIRKYLPHLQSGQSIFLLLDSGVLPPATATLDEIYSRHQDKDGFLYVWVAGEATFG